MKLTCQTCDIVISNEVVELKDLSRLNDKDGQDYIPKGFFIIDNQDFCPELKGAIMINIKDSTNSKYHSDGSRLNGCCGYDGLDGMNRICSNNHEIGTEMSDCWMPHCIALNPNLVKFI
ncbi:hypothetical protein [Pseudobacillus wudalianchiensis]|uniref:Uncharacterized protein n=1 Tax=Pseudobacillus wudalianchiensis TaxID=1743143 RepID=A0A1B9B902_9BACI|nr:hypothetical protein [Bacillus wudalianchiensis]OCA92576.1 hypothetical protein A8F95_02450 [Bacillus wudalianchiensis]